MSNLTTPCIEWWGPLTADGYGRWKSRGRAHRAIWEECFGPIPDGLCVLHTCDNPPCVNPEHLWLGTRKDNNRDAREKGRAKNPPPRTECPQGHEYTEENTIWVTKKAWPHPVKECRTCVNHRKRIRKGRVREQPLPEYSAT